MPSFRQCHPRRWFPVNLLLVVFSISAISLAADPPNVVYIIGDDQAWNDFGFMGHPHIKTPRIDQLAKESLTFRRGYVPSSLCSPSLAAILTGRYPQTSGITGNEPPLPPGVPNAKRYQDDRFLKLLGEFQRQFERQPRVPALLAEQKGYLSFQTGKWWGGSFATGGFTQGMSHGDPAKGGRHGDEGLKIGRDGLQPIYDFIKTARQVEKPFMVWYAPFLPHQPHTPPDRLLAKYQPLHSSLHVARYWAMCEWFDETVGELLDHLDQAGLKQDTIVVFVIDNGWIQKEDSPAYREDSKQSQYDGGLRTPIMIRWPGSVEPRLDDTAISTVDIAPTIYHACGVNGPADLPGINLLDSNALMNRGPVPGACFLHTANDLSDPQKSLTYRWIVSGDWKLVLPNAANVKKANKPGRVAGEIELFKIVSDINEENNLASQHPEKVQELTALVEKWWKETSTTTPGRP